MKTGAEIVIDILIKHKVLKVFGYPGAANAPLYEELSKSNISHILSCTEQGAANSAGAFARKTGTVGVCFATSGPGATNLITGIAGAYMDSVPIVAITAQVPCEKIGQDAFQEIDITGASTPFCKHNYLIKDINLLENSLNEAFFISGTGRPGPVLVDIPIDILTAKTKLCDSKPVDIKGYKPNYKGNGMQLKKAATAISAAKKPLILSGGGVRISDATDQLLSFADKLSAPIVTTLMGIDTVASNHYLNFGMIGSYGCEAANYALKNCDLIIVLGSRFADKSLSATLINKKSTVIHIDIDPAEIGKIVYPQIPIVGDIKLVLTELIPKINKLNCISWFAELNEKKADLPRLIFDTHTNSLSNFRQNSKSDFINPKFALAMLSQMISGKTIVTTEVGQNQMWTAINWNFKQGDIFLTSGGLGSMGYGLPAAIGAAIADSGATVIAIEGDGSFQMCMGELATISSLNIDIKIVILRNNCLGMVNELQKQSLYSKFAVSLSGSPNFCKIAEAYNIPSSSVSKNDDIASAFSKMLSCKGAYLLELIIDPEETTI